ncbi:MAG: TRAP transporter small permease [Betaproteobacteria bacterium]|nr:MAG: TRAP transporter small permease [Betaproteobacteria bacterium]
MGFFLRFLNWITDIFRWGAVATAAAMALLIAYAVLMRAVAEPVAGEHELIELMMLTMVMLGLAYTQKQQGHITIGLLVDRFSPRWQAAADLLGALLVFASCGMIGWANLQMAVEYATESPMSTDFLSVPLYPFKIIVGLGFWLWGLQAVSHIPDAFRGARGGDAAASHGGHL